jgi:DNA-binding GntR family transcriptional regulator
MRQADVAGAGTLAEQIRSAILGGEYAPRQRLIEVDLCERFATSRFLLRAALQELAAEGLVEFERNRGARVRNVSLAEAIEITEVRKLLEGLVAGRAARNVTRPEATALRRIAKQMRTAVDAGELQRYSELNGELHATLRDIADHGITAQLLEQLRALTTRHRFTLSLLPGRASVSLVQHEAIVAAVVAKDEVAAEQAMHAHLQSVIDAFAALAGAGS